MARGKSAMVNTGALLLVGIVLLLLQGLPAPAGATVTIVKDDYENSKDQPPPNLIFIACEGGQTLDEANWLKFMGPAPVAQETISSDIASWLEGKEKGFLLLTRKIAI